MCCHDNAVNGVGRAAAFADCSVAAASFVYIVYVGYGGFCSQCFGARLLQIFLMRNSDAPLPLRL